MHLNELSNINYLNKLLNCDIFNNGSWKSDYILTFGVRRISPVPGLKSKLKKKSNFRFNKLIISSSKFTRVKIIDVKFHYRWLFQDDLGITTSLQCEKWESILYIDKLEKRGALEVSEEELSFYELTTRLRIKWLFVFSPSFRLRLSKSDSVGGWVNRQDKLCSPLDRHEDKLQMRRYTSEVFKSWCFCSIRVL